jgi:putative DNA primase/helicase
MPPHDRVWNADPELRAEADAERERHRAARLEIVDARPPEFSDEALALQFSARHVDELRYVAAWSRWMEWRNTHWREDDTLSVFDRSRAVCRANSALLTEPKAAKLAAAVASAKTVAAIVSLARSDRRHAATVDQWDADDEALNTPNGIIDLRAGALGPHRRNAYCTKITGAAPGGECPIWSEFLDRIYASDRELIAYLQRVAGYTLTGSTSEHVLFFGHGTGANGKSVLIRTLSGVLGDYATTAPMETFTATQQERHPTDLAGLRGARLVTAAETEQGRRWAEAKIKNLTGGDKISARFMRQDFFEFVPQFKLLIAGNHRPGLRGVDEAIRRRLHLIPFKVTIPEPERDRNLSDKLQAEWPGILAWAIEGCREWQRVGLAPPPAVREATDSYLAAEDSIAQWLAECCVEDRTYAERSSVLFKNWKAWAEAAGEIGGSQKRFSQALDDRGFRILKREDGNYVSGLALKLA